jgi:CheY-like chemotaxis protein
VGEGRLAGAIARLLRWEAQLLAREAHDAATRSAALRGLEWAADFARALEAEPCAAWLDALRDRANDRPGHTPQVWSALGAPACADIAAQLEEHQSLAPLAEEARGWRGMATAVRGFEEPAAESVAGSVTLPPGEETAPGDAIAAEVPADGPAAAPGAGEEGLGAIAAAAGDPVLLLEFAAALAGWAGPHAVESDARNGRLEFAGTRPSDHPEPGRLSDAALESLRLLHRAAGRLAAPLIVADPEDGEVAWSVRLPLAEGARHLFVEAAGRRLALPWHAVVTYGLAEGGRSHVVLGRGLERVALALDWLHGLGPGRRLALPPAEAVAFDTPALAGLPHLVEHEDGERFIEVALVPLAPAPGEAAEAEPGASGESAGAAGGAGAGEAEALQEPRVPADNPERSRAPAPRALVADDSFTARVFLSRLLAQRGIDVDEAEDGPHALALLAVRSYELVFLDAEMPGGGALAIAGQVDPGIRGVSVVLVRDDAERSAAQAAGFAYALYKPFAEDEVAAALRALAEESRPGA